MEEEDLLDVPEYRSSSLPPIEIFDAANYPGPRQAKESMPSDFEADTIRATNVIASLKTAHALLKRDKESQQVDFERDRAAWQIERDSIQADLNYANGQLDAIKRERDQIKIERDIFQRERDQMRGEIEHFKGERDAIQRDRNQIKVERDQFKTLYDSFQGGGDTLRRVGTSLRALQHIEDTRQKVDDIEDKVQALDEVLALVLQAINALPIDIKEELRAEIITMDEMRDVFQQRMNLAADENESQHSDGEGDREPRSDRDKNRFKRQASNDNMWAAQGGSDLKKMRMTSASSQAPESREADVEVTPSRAELEQALQTATGDLDAPEGVARGLCDALADAHEVIKEDRNAIASLEEKLILLV